MDNQQEQVLDSSREQKQYGLEIKSYATLQSKLAIIKSQNLLIENKEGKTKYFKIDLEELHY